MKIPFNKPFFTGNEKKYIEEAIMSGKISGNGRFTQKCQHFLEEKYGFRKCLLTTSCTDALEMAAILLNLGPGDEVIVPSFTFVSTALAFAMRGASIKFADSCPDHPNIDPESVRKLITKRTKALVIMHYAGFPCQMDEILNIVEEHNLFLIEDAAHAIGSCFHDKAMGSFGHLSAFSFHETKNIQCGEGGCLVINVPELIKRAEIIWEKGTNRAAFSRGEVDYYEWKDLGSSFLPSEISAAFLFAQLMQIDQIQQTRKKIWKSYFDRLLPIAGQSKFNMPTDMANAGFFYLMTGGLHERNELIDYLGNHQIQAVFHYLPLHKSTFALKNYGNTFLPNSQKFADSILRLPFYNEISDLEIDYVCQKIADFYQ